MPVTFDMLYFVSLKIIIMIQEQNQIAVWLDHSKAHLITFSNNEPIVETVLSSDISNLREKGEGADGVHVSKYNATNNEHHKHNQERDDARYFYKVIADRLMHFELIYLFGPTTAKNELNNFMYDEKMLHNKEVTVHATDVLTENQIIAEAKKLFGISEKAL